MKLKKLMLMPTLLIPVSFLTSCSTVHSNIVEEAPHEYHEVKYIVPREMYPGVVNDPEEYDRLKSTPWTVTGPIQVYESGPKSYYATNGYITFEFEEDYVKFLEKNNYTIESFSKKVFEPLSLSPDIELFEPKAQVKFIFEGQGSSIYRGLALTKSEPIKIFASNDCSDPYYFNILGSALLREFSQVAGGGLMPKPVMDDYFNSKMWNELIKELPSNHPWKRFLNKIGEMFPWTRHLTKWRSDLIHWTKEFNILADLISLRGNVEEYNKNYVVSELENQGKVIELVGRIMEIYSQKLYNYTFKNTSKEFWYTDESLDRYYNRFNNIYNYPLHVLDYDFHSENEPLQSFYIMKATYHTWYNLANKNGLRIYFEDHKDSFVSSSINFTSFGSLATKNLQTLQILNGRTGEMFTDNFGHKLEFKINHKRYPLGFSKNPFTDYEYKYVADGGWVNEEIPLAIKLIDYDDLQNILFKLIDYDGNEISQGETMFQLDLDRRLTLFWNVETKKWEKSYEKPSMRVDSLS